MEITPSEELLTLQKMQKLQVKVAMQLVEEYNFTFEEASDIITDQDEDYWVGKSESDVKELATDGL
jgi:hypothetical protein